MTLPFRTAPVGDMFKRKIDDIFKELPKMFGIATDILAYRMTMMAQTIIQHCAE